MSRTPPYLVRSPLRHSKQNPSRSVRPRDPAPATHFSSPHGAVVGENCYATNSVAALSAGHDS